MGDCLTIPVANDFLARDANRIVGKIAKSLAINNPYLNIIETDTFKSGISASQRSVVQEAVAPVTSQAAPQWSAFGCRPTRQTIQPGSTEYIYSPLMYAEKGPNICVTDAFSAFRTALTMTERAITDHVQTLWTSWLRYRLFTLSAQKVVLNDAFSFSELLSTGFQTNFAAGITPNSPISFRFLKFLANHLMHNNLAGPEFQWGNGMNAHYRFISDQETIDAIRDEAVVLGNLRAGVTGGYRDQHDDLFGYTFEGPYQGIAFGVDQSILRADGVNADGTLDFVEPFIAQDTSNGVMRVVNEAWLDAPYQVSFLAAKQSFTREIPEEFLGEGMAKWMRQFWGGDVKWHNVQDNDCNIDGDTGFHKYKLAAAMRPERPAFFIPILHVRCQDNLGLTACTPQYYSQSA